METFDIIQLVRYGRVDEILNILDQTVSTREIFLNQVGPNLHQFIGLAACTGSIEILQRCIINYHVEIKSRSELRLHAIVGAASRGHNHVIEWLLEPWLTNRLIEQRQDSSEMIPSEGWLCPSLHKAILGQHVSTVELLVKKAKADVNACDDGKLKPLDVVADPVDKDNSGQMSRYEKIIDILVANGADLNISHPLRGTTPLHDAVKLRSHRAMKSLIDGGADVWKSRTEDKRTVLHLVAKAGLAETLRILVDHGRLREMDPRDFDVKDKAGKTPLFLAAEGGHQECVRILINKGLSLSSGIMKSGKATVLGNSGKKFAMLGYCCGSSELTKKRTVMDIIFERIPHPVTFLTEILDEQVTATDESGNNITMDFRLLVTKHSPNSENKFSDMDVVVALINAAQNMGEMAILQHPLLEIFLRLQYLTALRYGVCVVLSHLLIAGYLSWYFTHWNEMIRDGSGLVTLILCESGVIGVGGSWLRMAFFMDVVKLDKLKAFLLKTSIFISLIIIFYVILVFFIVLFSKVAPSYLAPCNSIIVMFLWMDLMMLSVQFPIIGEYPFMFFSVLINIWKVLFSFICLIIAFVLAFMILFPHKNQFDNPWKAFVKTLVMMTGEYDYKDLLFSTDQINSTSNDSTSAQNNNDTQQALGIFVFLVFVTVCSITLMNLMVGLAVNDIQELQKESNIRRLTTQANWVAGINRFRCCQIRSVKQKKLNLIGRSWISHIRIPTHVLKPLYDLALKNYNREKGPQTESPHDVTQEMLTAIQTSYAKIQSSLQRIVAKQQVQNSQIKRLTQDRKPKWQRRNL